MEELTKYLGVNIQNKKEKIEEINEILSKIELYTKYCWEKLLVKEKK